MLDLYWQIGILSVVLVFGIIIGLASGFVRLSKKAATGVAIGYGGVIIILTFLITNYVDIVHKIVYDYNFAIFMAIGIVIICAGFYTIREWNLHRETNAKASCVAMTVSCPCCIGAIIAVIILASPFIEVSTLLVGQYAAVLLSITIIAFYFASDAVVRIIKRPYPILLGNFMLFIGFYLLAAAIIIPNISTVIQSPMSPMTIPSIDTLIYAMVFVVILGFMGFYISKNKSNLIK
jgi:predicted transporter